MKNLLTLAVFALSALSTAQTVWYNGDNDNDQAFFSNSGPNLFGGASTVFEEFVWNSDRPTGSIMGTFIATAPFPQIQWEIRSGTSTSGLRTLIGSGNATATLTPMGTWTALPDMTIYSATAPIDELALTNGGTYFLGLAVVNATPSSGAGITTTSGANSVGGPVNNNDVLVYRPATGEILEGGPYDVSMGIAAAPVPEPATLAALGLGAAAMLRRRKRA